MWERLYQPRTVADTLEILAERGASARIVAGGTDVLVELQRGVKPTSTLVDVSALRELRYVREEDGWIAIGGLATHNDLLAFPASRGLALPLVQACQEVGAPQIRTRATIAGNLVTASPANDTIVALTAMGAQLVLESTRSRRVVDIDEFFTGFRSTVLQPTELVREIRVRPMNVARRGVFLKLGLRRAQAISVVSVAVSAQIAAGRFEAARIALGCLAPTVVRACETEALISGTHLDSETIAAACTLVCREVTPIGDVRGSAAYRCVALAALLERALERIAHDCCDEDPTERPVLLDTGNEERLDVGAFEQTIVANVNGTRMEIRDAQGETLLNALRDRAGLTGSKEGCGEGECGACTVWLDGKAVMSCLVPAAQAHGCSVVTIEGLARDGQLHPLQQAYIERGAVQCGFCIPGMLMAGAKVLQERPHAGLDELQAAISGNICRCTGYRKILDAMQCCSAAQTAEALT